MSLAPLRPNHGDPATGLVDELAASGYTAEALRPNDPDYDFLVRFHLHNTVEDYGFVPHDLSQGEAGRMLATVLEDYDYAITRLDDDVIDCYIDGTRAGL